MQPSDDIEKRLRETPLPGLKDGSHRDTLKQSLLAEMTKEKLVNDKASTTATTPATETPTERPRWRLRPWLVPAGVALIAIIVVGVQKSQQEAMPQRMRLVVNKTFTSVGSTIGGTSGGSYAEGRHKYMPSVPTNGLPRPEPESRNYGRREYIELWDATKQRNTGQTVLDTAGALGASGKGPAPVALPPAPAKAGEFLEGLIGLPDGGKQPDGQTGDNYARRTDNPFLNPAKAPLSTFSIDVDTASYTNVRRYLTQERQLPPKDAVRIEELVNYFGYDDPRPTDGKPVAIKTEVGPCPWNAAHRLVRIGLRAKSVTAEEAPPRNLVFLVDTSGSMDAPDRLPLLKKGLQLLVGTLRPVDRVAIVEYAGRAGLVLASTAGTEKQTILAALNRLEASGSTNGGEGIVMAYRIAQENFIKDGVNRVILGTDGDFNVGVTNQADLVRLIEEKRKSGILLSILGFGHGNLKDATMEKLAHHGNGHYAYVDNLEEAHRIFVEQGAALQVVAFDVKVQVEFNPARVGAYRLIGYENRLMKHEDFNDDKKDAGDMGSGHSVTALYEIVPAGKEAAAPGVDPLRYQKKDDPGLTDAAKSSELMLVKIRYKDPGAEVSKLLMQPVTDGDRPLAQTSADFRFAAAVAEFGLLLRDSPYKGTATLANVVQQARGSVGLDVHGHRAAFVQMALAAQQVK